MIFDENWYPLPMNLSNFTRTFRTVRHLCPAQIYWRLRYRRQHNRPAVVPELPETFRPRADFPAVPLVADPSPTAGEELIESLERGEFRYLNESRGLGREQTDWLLGRRTDSRLWAITLHYHAWAWELAVVAARGGPEGEQAAGLLRHYLADWIARCDLTTPGSRELAWNAYAIATRLGWWCRLYHLLGDSGLGDRGRQDWGPLEDTFLKSLWCQAAYLHEHLEWDLRANHLLRDAVGLAWAGRFFEGPEPSRWLKTATKLAIEQADEQVLADGGHFERSPMYHLHAMEDFLSLAHLLEDEAARARLRETWRRMAEWLAWVRHPDGQVPLLNDAAMNGACEPATMLKGVRYLLPEGPEGCSAQKVPDPFSPRRGGKYFPEFGLVVWHGDPWSIFFDVGAVGVDYQPGHAHADTLSLEVSYRGRRLFVDPGTFGYDYDARRRYDRATASHNTVCLDETDSSEVWHIFRVGRRARPVNVEVDFTADGCRAEGSHTGYDHLGGRPRHRRRLEVTGRGGLIIVDRFEGGGRHHAEGGLLVDPAWHIEDLSDGWRLRCGNDSLTVTLEAEGLDLARQQRPYHPEFGREEAAERLMWRGVLQFPYEMVFRVES